jgi:ribonuclease R
VRTQEVVEVVPRGARHLTRHLHRPRPRPEVARLARRVEAMDASVKAAEAALAMARLTLERTSVRAPSAGTVMARRATPGGAVGMADAMPLFELYDPAHLQVRADVPLAEVGSVGTGDRAEVRVDAFPDRTMRGEVTRFVHLADVAKNTVQVKVRLDELGKPIRLEKVENDISHQLIEEFMLLANKKVGEFVGKRKDNEQEKTFVYRIHDTPDDGRLLQLKTFVKHLGYKIPKNADQSSSGIIRTLMEQLKGQAEEDIIKQMAIRTMAKAEYSTQNIGHYGLAFEYYTHFTSPIRRYPDVMAHRLLQHYLNGGKSVNTGDYDVKCKHSSMMEKRAAESERASIKYKQVEYMLDHTGKIFEGIVSGLTSWGFYVEVGETKSEGMVSLKTLRDDHYEFDADKYIIRGLRKRTELHMGDTVMIKVLGGNLNQRTLDYEWVQSTPNMRKSTPN